MGLVPGFTGSDINRQFDNFTDKVESKEFEILKYIGEQFTNNARETQTYKDRTGNLRGSIGYIIGYNGSIKVKNLSGTTKGNREGMKTAKEVLSQNTKGFVLIGFAGMEYAAAVESKGYDVITGSSIEAKNDLKQMIKSL